MQQSILCAPFCEGNKVWSEVLCDPVSARLLEITASPSHLLSCDLWATHALK